MKVHPAWAEVLKTALLVGSILGVTYVYLEHASARSAQAPTTKDTTRHCTDLVAQSIADGTIESHESAQLFQTCVRTAQEPTP